MKWFDNWFRKKCKEAWHSENYPAEPSSIYVTTGSMGAVPGRRGGIDANGLSLSIYGADGGTVLEFRHYDPKTDRSDYALHVISQNENFEERVAQAITMEMLRKGIAR
jgi:hypothetical protein